MIRLALLVLCAGAIGVILARTYAYLGLHYVHSRAGNVALFCVTLLIVLAVAYLMSGLV